MILVRDVFYLKFGKAKDAKSLMSEFSQIMKEYTSDSSRFLTDFTGESYRLIFEATFADLGTYEKTIKESFAKDVWREWYNKFIPLVNRSEREILNVIEF
jgi:hypothetical protein